MLKDNAAFKLPGRITKKQAREYARIICDDISSDKSVEILKALRARALKFLSEADANDDFESFIYYINAINFLNARLAEAQTMKEE